MTYDYPQPPQGPPLYTYAPQAPRYERGSISVRNLSVPIVLVVIGGMSLFSASWWLATNLGDIKHAIDDLKKDVTGYVTSANDSIARLSARVDKIETNRWSIKDHDLWCAREEVQNPNWKCVPSLPIASQFAAPVPFVAPSWNGQVLRD